MKGFGQTCRRERARGSVLQGLPWRYSELDSFFGEVRTDGVADDRIEQLPIELK